MLMVVGCTPPQASFRVSQDVNAVIVDELKIGMTHAQVVELAGEPRERRSRCWQYSDGRTVFFSESGIAVSIGGSHLEVLGSRFCDGDHLEGLCRRFGVPTPDVQRKDIHTTEFILRDGYLTAYGCKGRLTGFVVSSKRIPDNAKSD